MLPGLLPRNRTFGIAPFTGCGYCYLTVIEMEPDPTEGHLFFKVDKFPFLIVKDLYLSHYSTTSADQPKGRETVPEILVASVDKAPEPSSRITLSGFGATQP